MGGLSEAFRLHARALSVAWACIVVSAAVSSFSYTGAFSYFSFFLVLVFVPFPIVADVIYARVADSHHLQLLKLNRRRYATGIAGSIFFLLYCYRALLRGGFVRLLLATAFPLLLPIAAYHLYVRILLPKFTSEVKRQFIKELTTTANGRKVTVGEVYLSILDGVFEASDILCHTPEREAWGWEAPLIARCGHMRVCFSFWSCQPFFQNYLRFPAKDIYSIVVSDIQVFVERKANIINYMLCDPSLEIPDPKTLNINENDVSSSDDDDDGDASDIFATNRESLGDSSRLSHNRFSSSGPDASGAPRGVRFDVSQPNLNPHPTSENGKGGETASLRAAKKGFSIFTTLASSVAAAAKTARGRRGGGERSVEGGAAVETRTADGKAPGAMPLDSAVGAVASIFKDQLADAIERMKEGVSVDEVFSEKKKVVMATIHMGQEFVHDMKEKVDDLTKPPPKKEGWVKKIKPDRFRIGSFVIRGMRVFTKNLLAEFSHDGGLGRSKNVGWHKPIIFKEIVFSAADLSCPGHHVSFRDADNVPLLGLRAHEIQHIMEQRMKSEAMKNNLSLWADTAAGEAMEWAAKKVRKDQQKKKENERRMAIEGGGMR